jgi:hypothetical protein
LVAAVAGARRGVIDLLSYRRSAFEADFGRAVAATTGRLRADVVTKKEPTLHAMSSGGSIWRRWHRRRRRPRTVVARRSSSLRTAIR